jgi:hypothetical protein
LQKTARLDHCNFVQNTLFIFVLWKTPITQDVPDARLGSLSTACGGGDA